MARMALVMTLGAGRRGGGEQARDQQQGREAGDETVQHWTAPYGWQLGGLRRGRPLALRYRPRGRIAFVRSCDRRRAKTSRRSLLQRPRDPEAWAELRRCSARAVAWRGAWFGERKPPPPAHAERNARLTGISFGLSPSVRSVHHPRSPQGEQNVRSAAGLRAAARSPAAGPAAGARSPVADRPAGARSPLARSPAGTRPHGMALRLARAPWWPAWPAPEPECSKRARRTTGQAWRGSAPARSCRRG